MEQIYIPRPLDLIKVSLPEDIQAMVETVAAGMHAEWLKSRLKEGWTLGTDGYMSSPLLKDWKVLDDEQKKSSRSQATECLKFIFGSGFDVVPAGEATGVRDDIVPLMARNAHEVWAKNKMADGWTYGPQRDNDAKKHPDLVPYDSLTEGEKEYDLKVARATVDIIEGLGLGVVRSQRLDKDVLDDLKAYLEKTGIEESMSEDIKGYYVKSAINHAVRKGYEEKEINAFIDDVTTRYGVSVSHFEGDRLSRERKSYVKQWLCSCLQDEFDKRMAPYGRMAPYFVETFNRMRAAVIEANNAVQDVNNLLRSQILHTDISVSQRAVSRWMLVDKLQQSDGVDLDVIASEWQTKAVKEYLGYRPVTAMAYDRLMAAFREVDELQEASNRYGKKNDLEKFFSRNPKGELHHAERERFKAMENFGEIMKNAHQIGAKRYLPGFGTSRYIGIDCKAMTDGIYLAVLGYDGETGYKERIRFDRSGKMENLPLDYPDSEVCIAGRWDTDDERVLAEYRKFDGIKDEIQAVISDCESRKVKVAEKEEFVHYTLEDQVPLAYRQDELNKQVELERQRYLEQVRSNNIVIDKSFSQGETETVVEQVSRTEGIRQEIGNQGMEV